MTVRFLTPASKELVQDIQFYEDQRVGLGIFYRVDEKEIVVAAVMDMRQDPDTVKI